MVIVNRIGVYRVKKLPGEFAGGADAVIAKALNAAGKRALKELPDTAGENYEFAPGASVTPHTRKIVKFSRASAGRLSGKLHYKTKAAGLNHYRNSFPPSSKGKGRYVYVTVRKGASHVLKKAFVININGNKIFEREPGATWRPGKKTGKMGFFPIRKLNSVPVGSLFQYGKVHDAFDEISEQEYDTALQKFIRLAVRRGNRAKAAAAKAAAE